MGRKRSITIALECSNGDMFFHCEKCKKIFLRPRSKVNLFELNKEIVCSCGNKSPWYDNSIY